MFRFVSMNQTKTTSIKSQFERISHLHESTIVDIYWADGVVVSEYKQDAELDLELAEYGQQIVAKITEGKSIPHLMIACPGLTVTKEVRDWGATLPGNKYRLATAVVCNTLAHRILGNFFIKIQKPMRPTKMFSEVPEAMEWLKQFLN